MVKSRRCIYIHELARDANSPYIHGYAHDTNIADMVYSVIDIVWRGVTTDNVITPIM